MDYHYALKSIAGLVLAGIAAHTSAKQAPQIIISPLDSTRIQLEYKLPKHCDTLALLQPYGERTRELRQQWQPLNKCSAITKQGNILNNIECKSIRFAIPIQATTLDRIYPVAYPLDEQGVLIHTATMAISDQCGEPRWQFKSPKGAVILDGKNRGKKVAIAQYKNPSINYTGVFLSYLSRPKAPGVISTQQTPAWITTSITTAAQDISRYYQQHYPRIKQQPSYLFVSNTKANQFPRMQADVSNPAMIRFGFINYPEQGDPINQLSIMQTTAHEFAHKLQPAQLKSTPVIHEGGAEFIRWISSYRLGWSNKNDLGLELSQSISECLQITKTSSWKSISDQQKSSGAFPYKCGLTLHAIALAAGQTPNDAEETLHKYYQQKIADFAQALECGPLNNCTPKWLPAVFTSDKPFIDLVNQQLDQLGLVKAKSIAPPGTTSTNISGNALMQLIQEDCSGRAGFWPNADHFLLDATNCKTVKNHWKIQRVNGVSYFNNPVTAIKEQNRGCATQGHVTLETQDQQTAKVPCTREYVLQETWFDLDAERLVALLDKQQTGKPSPTHK